MTIPACKKIGAFLIAATALGAAAPAAAEPLLLECTGRLFGSVQDGYHQSFRYRLELGTPDSGSGGVKQVFLPGSTLDGGTRYGTASISEDFISIRTAAAEYGNQDKGCVYIQSSGGKGAAYLKISRYDGQISCTADVPYVAGTKQRISRQYIDGKCEKTTNAKAF